MGRGPACCQVCVWREAGPFSPDALPSLLTGCLVGNRLLLPGRSPVPADGCLAFIVSSSPRFCLRKGLWHMLGGGEDVAGGSLGESAPLPAQQACSIREGWQTFLGCSGDISFPLSHLESGIKVTLLMGTRMMQDPTSLRLSGTRNLPSGFPGGSRSSPVLGSLPPGSLELIGLGSFPWKLSLLWQVRSLSPGGTGTYWRPCRVTAAYPRLLPCPLLPTLWTCPPAHVL